MSLLFNIDQFTCYRHAGAHIAQSDLQPLLYIPTWPIHSGQHWGVIGGKEEQRSALLDLLHEKNSLLKNPMRVSEISLAEQQRRISSELIKSKTGVADEIFAGTPVHQILTDAIQSNDSMNKNSAQPISKSSPLLAQLIDTLNFSNCLHKHFRELSSGETRRLLIIVGLISAPELLLVHDPLEGLDSFTRPIAGELINQALQSPNKPMKTASNLNSWAPATIRCSIFAASRAEQLPSHTTHLAYIDQQTLHLINLSTSHSLPQALSALASRLTHAAPIDIPELPQDHPFHQHKQLKADQPLVSMRNVTVSYAGESKPVFKDLNWAVQPGQHWRISGANGSGKTTLLKLITGDHPQVYNNAIEVCGFRRGSGESIWEVKRHIGYMSSEMLWSYRGSGQLAGKTLSVVMSGLYDSIGLYAAPNAADKKAASQWLDLFEISDLASRRFQTLGLAEQRLVLIARAMIKRPSLLILDEPLQGLDGDDRKRVLAVIEKLISSNASTLLYVSHHDDEQVIGANNTLTL